MKTNKSYKEAILRAYPTEKETAQDQEHLLALRKQAKGAAPESNKTPVVETHKNIMRSWFNLRSLDQNMDESKNPKQKKRN